MPLPPPPAAAFSSTGYPARSAASRAAATSLTGPSDPSSTGRPASRAAALAWILSPIRSITSGEGPTKVIPASAQARAKSAFSERNPYPGWMASHPVISAAPRTLAMLRYESRAAGGPMQTASSARSTARVSASAVE